MAKPQESWARGSSTKRTVLFAFLGILLIVSLTGCGGAAKNKEVGAPPAGQVVPTATESTSASPRPTAHPAPTVTPDLRLRERVDRAAGKALVQAQCAACHALADAGIVSAQPPIAPALDHIGKHATRVWLETELIRPCAHPRAAGDLYHCDQMPSFGALTQRQRDQIVEYLLSRR